MARFWQRMAMMFGHRWTSQYGKSPTDSNGEPTASAIGWAEEIGDLKLEQLAFGISMLRDVGDDWWPNIPAFRALCVGASEPMHASHRPFPKALPRPKADEYVVRSEIVRMKSMLRGVMA